MYIPALLGHGASRPEALEFFNEALLKKRFLLREDRAWHDLLSRPEDTVQLFIYRTTFGITA